MNMIEIIIVIHFRNDVQKNEKKNKQIMEMRKRLMGMVREAQ